MAENFGIAIEGATSAVADWYAMLRDQEALLAMPGAYHKTLLNRAHAMHCAQLIGPEDLGELLEFADAALLFAIEALLDIDSSQ